mgnify:CR=1 FL=1
MVVGISAVMPIERSSASGSTGSNDGLDALAARSVGSRCHRPNRTGARNLENLRGSDDIVQLHTPSAATRIISRQMHLPVAAALNLH